MGRLGLGLPKMAPVQGDLFPDSVEPVKVEPVSNPYKLEPPEPVKQHPEPEPQKDRKPLAESFAAMREKYQFKDPEPEPLRKLNPPESPDSSRATFWDVVKYIAYGLLVLVELTLTGLAMWSLAHSPLVGVALVVVGVSASILGIYLFLRGDLIGTVAWVVYAALFVLLNWSWTVGNLIVERDQSTVQAETMAREREELARNDSLILALTEKASKTPSWATASLESLERQVIALQSRNREINAVLSVPVEASATGTFDTLGGLFGVSGDTAARWWWLVALGMLQVFQAMLAPRRLTRG